CGMIFEIFQSINDNPIKECPDCKGLLRRLVSGGCGLIFKGSGFYITDYKRKSTTSSTQSSKGEDKSKPSEEKKDK
ncbi:MAG: zinc ribbon domain-containing protein, partial [Candidatus Omnitrophica bacterium]|nr:zinc ribbon domain-containing protein [Candidatus Omnitrophota bacterium]